jgi:large subunit ribosomal protein L21e
MKRIGGNRRKTRGKFSKSLSQKGKLYVNKYLQELSEGERVLLKADPTHQGGLFFPRFHGKIGTVVGQQGECYRVSIKDGGKAKTCIVHPVHLSRTE